MNIIVFDTETVGCISQALLNVGYKIVDINPATGDVVRTFIKRDYIVREHYNNSMLMINDMFVGMLKYQQYKNNIENGGSILRSTEQILRTMRNDIEKYKPMFGYAYNCAFDIDKFTKTSNEYGVPNPLDGLIIHDIWGYAYNYICTKPEYADYCKNHNLLTESERFIKTSVEGVTAYLNDDPDFKEEHTALSDVEWELRILQECIRRGADITQKLARGKNLPSGKVFTKTFIIDDEEIVVKYTKTIGKMETSETIKFVNEQEQ